MRSARERNYIADVCHTGHKQQQTLETKAETGVRATSVFTGIQIPPHILHRYIQFLDTGKQLIVIGFTFRTSDNLANLREQNIHGTYSLAVLVLLHIECLDFLRIVGQDYRTLEVFFHQVTFVFSEAKSTPQYTGNSNLCPFATASSNILIPSV